MRLKFALAFTAIFVLTSIQSKRLLQRAAPITMRVVAIAHEKCICQCKIQSEDKYLYRGNWGRMGYLTLKGCQGTTTDRK